MKDGRHAIDDIFDEASLHHVESINATRESISGKRLYFTPRVFAVGPTAH